MDENEITEGLRGIVLAEPPLGFEPDEVATKAARRLRDRRVALGSGLAVAVVAVAAVTFAANVTGGGDTIGAGPSTAPTRKAPDHDLSAEAERNNAHLRVVLPRVLSKAGEFKVGAFTQQYQDSPGSWASFTTEVRFRDDAGPAYFTLTVAGPQSASDWEPLAQRCDPHPVGEPGWPAAEYKLPNGKSPRCTKIPQPDGSTVVVEETAVATVGKDGNLHLARKSGLDAMHYRTDGSIVGIVNDDLISVRLAEEYGETKPDGSPKIDHRVRPPLTQQELVALVTDPGFTTE